MSDRPPLPDTIYAQMRQHEWCRDLDNDCADIEDFRTCWLHDVTVGVCPYLSGHYKRGEKVVKNGG